MNSLSLRNSLVLLLCLNASSAWAMGKKNAQPILPDPTAFPMVLTNPYSAPDVPKPGAHDYSVNVKFTNHGLKNLSQDTMNRLVHAVEKIYDQCDGVMFHVNVVGTVQSPAETLSDDVTGTLPGGILTLGDRFQNFYSQFPNSPATDVISVDLVDDMSASIRASETSGGSGESFLGQALAASMMDNLYTDSRSPQYRSTPLSDVGGNTIRLAMNTLAITEKNNPIFHQNDGTTFWGNPKIVMAALQYQSALLAHEMGHILMEVQDGKGTYIDHYCPGEKTQCTPEMLMSPGGYPDRVYLRVPQMDTPIGYSPLPKVEPEQCAALIRHPLVKLEN